MTKNTATEPTVWGSSNQFLIAKFSPDSKYLKATNALAYFQNFKCNLIFAVKARNALVYFLKYCRQSNICSRGKERGATPLGQTPSLTTKEWHRQKAVNGLGYFDDHKLFVIK